MTDVIRYLNLASTGSAALCVLVAMLFIKSPGGWFRLMIVGVAALAIAAPFFHLRTTQGLPNPWLDDGHYRLLGWKTDEAAEQIYVMVTHPRFGTPREFQVPFDLDLALELQNIRAESDFEELICMRYDTTGAAAVPVEVRRFQASHVDFQSCGARWSDR